MCGCVRISYSLYRGELRRTIYGNGTVRKRQLFIDSYCTSCGDGTFTFQVTLFPDGQIVFAYREVGLYKMFHVVHVDVHDTVCLKFVYLLA